MAAITKNDVVAAKAALVADPKLIDKGRGYSSPLSRAFSGGKLEMVQLLLDNGADPNQETSHGSALSSALYNFSENWKGIAELLLKKGAKVDAIDNEGNTPLMRMVSHGSSQQRERVQFLLDNGASVTVRNRSGRSALDIALASGRGTSGVGPLLLEKADIKVRDDEGNTVLHTILNSNRGNAALVQLALTRGAEVNARNSAGDTPLHFVVSAPGSLIKILLNAGADANAVNYRGDIPLHIALRRHDISERLPFGFPSSYTGRLIDSDSVTPRGTLLAPLTEKSNIDLRDQFGFSPLLLATVNRDQESRDLINERAPKLDSTSKMFDLIAQGNTAELTPLITAKPFLVYFRLPDGTTPLHVAAQWGTLGCAEFLVQKGADVNARDSRGETPLHEALTRPSGIFLRRSKKMVEFLVGKGANVNALDIMDSSPLHRAMQSAELELVTILVDKGARVDARDKSGSMPLVQSVSKTADTKLAQLLMTKGAKVTQRDRNGNTPLLRAVAERRSDLVKLFLDQGADVTSRDAQGRTPLIAVAGEFGNTNEEGALEIATLLLAKGADPNDKSLGENLITRLVQNSSTNSLAMLKLLLDSKKVSLKTSDRNPILFTAIYFGRKEVVEALIEAGADVNEKDKSGKNLLKQAVLRGNPAIVELLKAKGAKED